MRLLIINLLSIGMLLAGATSASAIALFFDNLQALNGADLTSLNAGDRISIQLKLDTEGETNVSAVFVSTFHNAGLLTFVENPDSSSPGAILFNTSTFEGVSRAAQPQTSTLDIAGRVRAASFASATGSGVASANQLLSTLVFEVRGAPAGGPSQDTNIQNLLFAGDLIAVDNVEVAFTLADPSASFTVNPIPEPGTALLMGLGLLGLGAAGRRR